MHVAPTVTRCINITVMAESKFSFDTCLTLWNEIPVPNELAAVPVKKFCDASEELCKIFDSIDGMSLPKSDIVGNVNKIRKNITDENATLASMIDAEAKHTKEGSTGLALLWLKRALFFVEGIMAEFINTRLTSTQPGAKPTATNDDFFTMVRVLAKTHAVLSTSLDHQNLPTIPRLLSPGRPNNPKLFLEIYSDRQVIFKMFSIVRKVMRARSP